MTALLLANASAAAPVFGVFGFFMIIALLLSIFWIWMLIDCLMSDREPMEKLVWVLVILFTHILGAIIYFFVGRGGRAGATTP